MKKLTYVTLAAVVLISLLVPSVTLANGGDDKAVQVLIQVTGSVDQVINRVNALGGAVRFRYENVSMVAATIPASQMASIANLAGVAQVEKDSMMYLLDDPVTMDVHPKEYVVQDVTGISVKAIDLASIDPAAMPQGYAGLFYTGGDLVWSETALGSGSVVAVVDTGVVPNVCIGHAVIGAPGFPDGYNATGDGVLATDPSNHWHGTHVSGMIASACSLDFTADPNDPLYQAVATHIGWPADFVPVYGQAPFAQIYPVKVFPQDGSGSPTSVILDGLDHLLTLKKDGLLDIDIVNMSLGGPTVWDGRDSYDRFIVEMEKAGMVVVTSAGNEGPIPNSVGSPGTAFSSLSVGALDYAMSSRTFYEYLGLADMGMSGQGLVMRPTDETRVVNFSSRGPLSDGRAGPDMVALGHWTFAAGPLNELRWAGGTSFSSPTVAGAAALLNAWLEAQDQETAPARIRSALVQGANRNLVGPAWQDINDQGWGALDVPAALNVLKTGHWQPVMRYTGPLQSNVLSWPRWKKTDTWESGTIIVGAGEPYDLVFQVNEFTSKVTIEVFDIQAPDNSAYAYWPNALEIHAQSAKRTGWPHAIDGVYWYTFAYGDAFDIVIEDGLWSFWGMPWVEQPMEPGLAKVSLMGDYSNESPVSFKVRITRENNRKVQLKPIAKGNLKMGESVLIPVQIPADVTMATFDLDWLRKWNMFPTSDIDMVVYDPSFALASLDGATGNAPERVVIDDPEAGTWYVYIEGYEMYRPDLYRLFLTLD